MSRKQIPISKDSLDIAVDEMMKKYKVPGVSVAIIKSGKLDTTFCYGLLEEKTEQKIDPQYIVFCRFYKQIC